MKKVFLFTLVASALGMAGSAMAQAAGPAGGAPQQGIGKGAKGSKADRQALAKINEEILAKLNLTEDQKNKLNVHKAEMEKKLLELRKGSKGAANKDELKEKVKAIRKENEKFMKETLTKDQMREFQKLRREAIQKLREKKDGTTTPPNP